MYIDEESNTPTWGESSDTAWLRSMIVFNNTGNKKSLLLLLFKLLSLIHIHFPCLSESIIKFLTFSIKTFFSPMA